MTNDPRAQQLIDVYKSFNFTLPDWLKYDAGQKRDESGKWTSGGGANVSGLAEKLKVSASEVEPEITGIVSHVVEDGGGELIGMEFRLKSQESIESKIKRDAEEENISPEQAASGVTDLVRYTAVFDGDELVENAQGLQSALAQNGWTKYDEKFRNYFSPPPPDRPYRGYNTVYRNSKGQTFELQFHTPTSIAYKERAHKLYETARELPAGARRTQLYQQMNDIWSDFPSPAGWENLPGVRM